MYEVMPECRFEIHCEKGLLYCYIKPIIPGQDAKFAIFEDIDAPHIVVNHDFMRKIIEIILSYPELCEELRKFIRILFLPLVVFAEGTDRILDEKFKKCVLENERWTPYEDIEWKFDITTYYSDDVIDLSGYIHIDMKNSKYVLKSDPGLFWDEYEMVLKATKLFFFWNDQSTLSMRKKFMSLFNTCFETLEKVM